MGAAGGAFGSCGTLLVTNFAARNWIAFEALATAAGAVATFSAVLVALYPIWLSEQRRKAAATAVRTTALGHVTQLHAYLRACQLTGRPVPDGWTFFREEAATAALDALLQLMPRTEVLDAEEQHALAMALVGCEAARVNGTRLMKLNDREMREFIQQLFEPVCDVQDRFAKAIGSDLSTASLDDVTADVLRRMAD